MARGRSTEKEQKWRGHLAGLAASGLSIRAFAAREGLNVHTLGNWKAKLRDEAVKGASPPFVAVQVTEAKARGGAIEIVLRDGVSLRVCSDFDEATLARVVRNRCMKPVSRTRENGHTMATC